MATSLARGVFPFPSRTRQRSGGDVGSTKVRRKLGGDNGLLLRPSPQAAALPPGGAGEEEERPMNEMKEIWGACVVPAGEGVMVGLFG